MFLLVSVPLDHLRRGSHCLPQMEALSEMRPTCLQVAQMLRLAVMMACC